MFGLIGTIIMGAVVGALARFVMPGVQAMGWFMTIAIGVGGSVLAGFLGQAMGWYQQGQGAGWIGSIVGALVILFVVGKLKSGGPKA